MSRRPLYDFRAQRSPEVSALRNLRIVERRPYNWLADEFTDAALALVLKHCADSPSLAVRQAGTALEAHFDQSPLRNGPVA